MPARDKIEKKPRLLDPFRRAIVGGLGVLLPPLLTIVIFLWVWNTIASYLLVPLEGTTRRILVDHFEDQILPAATVPTEEAAGIALIGGEGYRRALDGQFMPADHYDAVLQYLGPANMPATALETYRVYVDRTFLQRHIVVPVFLSVFLLVLYLLGKFLAAGMGRFFWSHFEGLVTRLPLVRNVYSSVKQVTDFMFSEQELGYTRVVAIEYPRKGIWSLAFVTGEGLIDVEHAANEPLLAVLVPTSPMPFTGFTILVKKSETVDLNITLDQSLQFIMSCGVVAPRAQRSTSLLEQVMDVEPLPPKG